MTRWTRGLAALIAGSVALSLTVLSVPASGRSAAAEPTGPVWLHGERRDLNSAAVAAPMVVLTPGGGLTATWQDASSGSSRIVAVDRPAFGDFGTRVAISDPATVARIQQNLALDSAGNLMAVWYFSDGADAGVAAAFRPAGGTWQNPIEIQRWTGRAPTGTENPPDLEPAGAGAFQVAYTQYPGTAKRAMFARFTPSTDWQAPVDLSPGANAEQPSLEVSPATGIGLVAWFQPSSTSTFAVLARTVNRATIDAMPLTGGNQAELAPLVSMAADGSATVIWQRGAAILSRRWLPSTGWEPLSPPVSLGTVGSNYWVVPVETAAGTTAVWNNALPDGTHQLLSSARTATGWSDPVTVAPPKDSSYDLRDGIFAAPDGTVYAPYQNYETNQNRVVTRPPGQAWQAPYIVDPVPGGKFSMAFDQYGNAVLGYRAYVPSGTPRLSFLDVTRPELSSVRMPTGPVEGAPAAFSAGGRDLSSRALTWTWDFGDGSTASGAQVSHRYSAAGSYPVRVSVTDGAGRITTASYTVTVAAAPPAPPPPPPPPPTPGERVPVKLKKRTLLFDLDLIPTARTCPAPKKLAITVKAKRNGRKRLFKLAKTGYRLRVAKVGKVCRVTRTAKLTKTPKRGWKVLVKVKSKKTKARTVRARRVR